MLLSVLTNIQVVRMIPTRLDSHAACLPFCKGRTAWGKWEKQEGLSRGKPIMSWDHKLLEFHGPSL